MYVPEHFTASPTDIHDLLNGPSAANLITMTQEGLLATLLPFVYDATIGDHGALHTHVARNNTQWSEPTISESLAIIQGPDAYISPSWYAAKTEHGRVVPTWNYSTAHVYGNLMIHEDPAWLGNHIRALTNTNEAGSEPPWTVDDAPKKYIAGQLRAIVGIELVITRIDAKKKLSQNRPETDIHGVIAGLQGRGHFHMTTQIEQTRARITK
ncbi:FMN-binding negative transcriptional regulator [Arthrobacter sp. H14-L1]|uniref:FMN-binding negative transcriptional regulator n=1 Tax=Arthrobacter sp. H14-L1 TaxID=2996697 RepID=UPI002271B59F|nr:FMN-binding negative transcriptional regulator [Arthrobacter sp. H14-L1]MCY0906247.1 FMN-binding negative transcriptional regulator [Arthrobacter sp. H14-L1]